MSISDIFVENEDLFHEESYQPSGDVTRYLVRDIETGSTLPYSSIYVQSNDREIHITVSALENDRFPPNSRRLHEFLRNNAQEAGRPEHSRHRYEIQEGYIHEVIRILRGD